MVTAAARRSRTRVTPAARLLPALRLERLGWSGPAWGAIGVTALFLGITCWWLTQDRSIPIFDAGLHLSLAYEVHEELGAGKLLDALTLSHPYPPFAYLIGSLGILIGGVGVAPLVLAENIVFVPLLALGCYKVARLAFGPMAGLLAVVFALGSPLIIAQFHVFMTDAPETAMVAVSLWLIIATEGFSKLGASALAGLAVGIGMLTKEPFASFVVGVVLVTAVRGGRGALRGFLLFALVALVLALPWYVHELKELGVVGREATQASSGSSGRLTGVAPPRLSPTNLEWYLWSFLNAQLYLPLFLFAAVGWVWAIVGFARRRPVSPLALELVAGAFCSWAIITETFLHDTRYSMPLLVYLAVFGAGWIVRLPTRWRLLASAALVLVALVNTLGASFGVGSQVKLTIARPAGALEQPGTITIAQNSGFLVAGPRRDGNLLGMLQELRRYGVREVGWFAEQAYEPDFSQGGLTALTQIAGLGELPYSVEAKSLTGEDAILFHEPVQRGAPPPCVRLDDGTGVWVRLGYPFAKGVKDFCPRPRPHFYG